MKKLEDEIRRIKDALLAAGLTLSGEKPLPYGHQLLISASAEKANINVYAGKKGISIVVGGAGGKLKEELTAICEGRQLSYRAGVEEDAAPAREEIGFEGCHDFDGSWIGCDESGKGDVFGPLVTAAVRVDQDTARQLTQMGIKDSKLLSDSKIGVLADSIRELCPYRYVEKALLPADYNVRYKEFRARGLNLNHLLAVAHAENLEGMLAAEPCRFALIDQFAAENVVSACLQPLGRTITVRQIVRGERNVAVAAASILARDRFVTTMAELSARFAVRLPKGAGAGVKAAIREFVALHGAAQLKHVGKLHFKTFDDATAMDESE